jgi:hypothetical protein
MPVLLPPEAGASSLLLAANAAGCLHAHVAEQHAMLRFGLSCPRVPHSRSHDDP